MENIRPFGLIAVMCLFALTGCLSQIDGTVPGVSPQPGTDSTQGDISKRGKPSHSQGKVMFWAGGCASCHAPAGAKGEARLLLGGGLALKTAFGIFRVPNISPDKNHGIGKWSQKDFANAMLRGISPDGAHYFPAFPYTSYSRMTDMDVSSLWAYLKTLPPVANKVSDHVVPLLLKNRHAAGLWKKLYFKPGKVVKLDNKSPEATRGQYLVEGAGHCGECHTPRNSFGGFDYTRWLAGGKAPEGEGTIPNITPHETGIGGRTIEEIVASLEPGTSHEESSTSGSTMADVRRNMAELSVKDRRAIAAYLLAVPAVSSRD